jgi:hypothetical protein
MAESPTASAATRSEAFLDAFFSPPNRLTRAACAADSGKRSSRFAPWLDLVRASPVICTVLPRWNGGESFDWYAIATDDAVLRGLKEELTAFVGPTWSTFRGQPAALDPDDPVDRAVLEFAGGRAFRFHDGGQPRPMFDALERLRAVWAMRPARTADTPRAVGRVLRDFHMALRNRNRDAAEEQLEYLRRRGQLIELNRLFLRVQMLDALGETSELLRLPHLADLLQARRPLAVTQALLAAVYRELVAPLEIDPTAALQRYREQVVPTYGSLLASDIGMRRPAALKMFMLGAAAAGDVRLRDRLMGVAQGDPPTLTTLQSFATLLMEEAPSATAAMPVAQADPLALAADAFDAGELGTAFELARIAPGSLRRALLLCRCAFEAPSLAADETALEAVFALPQVDYDTAMQRRIVREFVEAKLVTPVPRDPADAPPPVTDWPQWLDRLYAGALGDSAIELARQGSEEWNPVTLAARPQDIQSLAERLLDPPAAAAAVLNDSLPHLLRFFQRDDAWPRGTFGPVYGAMAYLLAQTSSGSDDDLALFSDLVEARLAAGISRGTYCDLVEATRALVETYAAPATVDWMLDMLEVFLARPRIDEVVLQDLVRRVGLQFFRHYTRLTQEQRLLLERSYRDANLPEEEFLNLLPRDEAKEPSSDGAVPADVDPLRKLAGKTIAVFTLNTRAAQAIEQLLPARVPGVKVQTIVEPDASKRMKQLAQQADVFVMTLGSAKHAATTFIADHRPKGMPLLRTGRWSRGSAGILSQLVSYACSI